MIILDPDRELEDKGYGVLVRDLGRGKHSIELEFRTPYDDFRARTFSWKELDIIISSLLKFRLLNSDKAPFMED